MFRRITRNGISIITVPELESSFGIRVIFTNRLGGFSKGPYESLNLSFNVGDDYESVLANRMKVAREIEIPLSNWVTMKQIHSNHVIVIKEEDKGRGGIDYNSALPSCDALVSSIPGVACAALVADCVPVVIACPSGHAVAVAHAGWRGALLKVCVETSKELEEDCGLPSSEFLAFVGPHVCANCFEVGEEIAEKFLREYPHAVRRKEFGIKIDLGMVIREQLEECGIPAEMIFEIDDCTMCDSRYYSFRRLKGITGRQACFVAIL